MSDAAISTRELVREFAVLGSLSMPLCFAALLGRTRRG
jgi:hypothetical protein